MKKKCMKKRRKPRDIEKSSGDSDSQAVSDDPDSAHPALNRRPLTLNNVENDDNSGSGGEEADSEGQESARGVEYQRGTVMENTPEDKVRAMYHVYRVLTALEEPG